jgi:hypothetical protein
MPYLDEIQQDQIQLSVARGVRLQAQAKLTKPIPAVVRELRPNEINFSGSQILVGLASVVGSVGLLVWAVVRLWLFGG